LLTKYIADAENISYEDALNEVVYAVSDWKKVLRAGESLLLKNIGDLWLNEEDSIQFEPFDKTNYLTEAFGLSPLVSQEILRETLKEKVEILEDKAPILFTPERREKRPYLKYAAIALLAIAVSGTVGYKLYQDQLIETTRITEREVQNELEENIQKATFFNETPLELPSISLNLIKEPLKYHIIAGAFRIEGNADVKVNELHSKGYEEAERVGVNKYGLHQVAYASFSDVNEALAYLRKIKTTEAPEAWLLVQEN